MYDSITVRNNFLDFFKSKEHLVWPSSSLIPVNDPTLLLIGAGMAPFKTYFKGESEPPKRRMATCQKCVRADDIDRVGKTIRHHTFFEMLGNFSFGDYFKKETIVWAWEYFTRELKFSPDKLYVSIHKDDDEAFKIWNNDVKVPSERIYRMSDNFWGPIGQTGPCGPCSEIMYDLGEEFGCGKADCRPGCDCDRYLELWNLVFTGLNKTEKGEFEKLPAPCIDTGLGFERLLMVLQNKRSPYETDLFKQIIYSIDDLSQDKNDDDFLVMAKRIIADHLRSAVFMVSDNITPSNEGRGYVLRRLIRRAGYFGKKINISGRFLYKLAPVVINLMHIIYTELKNKEDYIINIIRSEESVFEKTLEKGSAFLANEIKSLKEKKEKIFSGDKSFLLHDTYGFPYEMIEEILNTEKMTADRDGFNKLLEKQKERSRRALGEKISLFVSSGISTGLDKDSVVFTGYENLAERTKIIRIYKDEKEAESVKDGSFQIVLQKTPFYSEQGGQKGDRGFITAIDGSFKLEVFNTVKNKEDISVNIVRLVEGVCIKTEVTAEVDRLFRKHITINHTATHLLQSALRKLIGSHITQSGSLVTQERLRFDFSHFKPLTDEEIRLIEDEINANIDKTDTVTKEEMTLENAGKLGALAFFEDKYANTVRVVTVKNKNQEVISRELCGGTHLDDTSEIGYLKIISESSIGTGIRRIEAKRIDRKYRDFLDDYCISLKYSNIINNIRKLSSEKEEIEKKLRSKKIDFTGLFTVNEDIQKIPDEIEDDIRKNLEKLYEFIHIIGCPYKERADLFSYYIRYEDHVKNIEKILSRSELSTAFEKIDEIIKNKRTINGIDVVSQNIENGSGRVLRDLVDAVKLKLKSGIIMLSFVTDGNPFLACGVTDDLKCRFNAGKIVSNAAGIISGKGGGRPDFAQAGGKDSSRLQEALESVFTYVKENSN